jgi:hypothetical protein
MFNEWVEALTAELGDERDRLQVWAGAVEFEHGISPTIELGAR